jgi:predicted transcriptional regulator
MMDLARFEMTTREALHQDPRHAADEDGPPLDAEALAALDRGLADVAAGRVTPLEDYERKRGLT